VGLLPWLREPNVSAQLLGALIALNELRLAVHEGVAIVRSPVLLPRVPRLGDVDHEAVSQVGTHKHVQVGLLLFLQLIIAIDLRYERRGEREAQP
jgi:hypothetical protein